MAKRHAERELNHENWDQEDEKEEAGTFVALDEKQLQNRVIKKAKRSLPKAEGSFPSPFSAFSGFTTKPANSSFNSASNEKKSEECESKLLKKAETQNGSSAPNPSESANIAEDKETSAVNQAKRQCTTPSEKKFVPRSLEYFRQLQTLNESVLKWMQIHLAKNPCCDFTPVFSDYKTHLDRLDRTYPIIKAKSSDFSFKMASAPVRDSDSSTDATDSATKSAAFKFGENKDNTDTKVTKDDSSEMKYGAGFASNTTNTSTVSFGRKVAHTATSSSSPSGPTSSFRTEADAQKKEDSQEEKKQAPFTFSFKSNFSSSGFTFKNDSSVSDKKPFSFAVAPSNDSTTGDTAKANDEEEYVPPKNEFKAVAEEGSVYSKRCKLFFKKDDSYVEKGIGTLYIKPIEDKMQLIIRADTSLGNILLNILLSSSLPMQRTGKNNVLIICIPNPAVDPKNPDSKEPVPTLLRVKTSEDADELLEMLNKYKS